MKPRVHLLLSCVLAAGCGGPSLAQLVDGKHYREAVCLAADGSSTDRARVGGALLSDEDIYVHVHVVTHDELRSLLAEGADAIGHRAIFVRVRAQGNVLPIDHHSVGMGLVGDGPVAPARLLDEQGLAWATHETVPKAETRESVNPLGLLVTFATLGLFGNLGTTETTVSPSDDQYRAAAPIAFTLHSAMPATRCWALDLDARGQACEAFYVVDRHADVPVNLVIDSVYEAERQPSYHGATCSVAARATVALGRPGEIQEKAEALFGSRGRRLSEISSAAPSAARP
jgi:hypothetical protein